MLCLFLCKGGSGASIKSYEPHLSVHHVEALLASVFGTCLFQLLYTMRRWRRSNYSFHRFMLVILSNGHCTTDHAVDSSDHVEVKMVKLSKGT